MMPTVGRVFTVKTISEGWLSSWTTWLKTEMVLNIIFILYYVYIMSSLTSKFSLVIEIFCPSATTTGWLFLTVGGL